MTLLTLAFAGLFLVLCVRGRSRVHLSEYWSPQIVSECREDYGDDAPCIARKFPLRFGTVHGYELIFRDFEIRYPTRVPSNHLDPWIAKDFDTVVGKEYGDRCWREPNKRTCRYYRNYGQIFTFQNGEIPTRRDFDAVGLHHCLPLHSPSQKSSLTKLPTLSHKTRDVRRDEGKSILIAFFSDAMSSRLHHFLNGTFSSLILSTLLRNITKETQLLLPPPMASLGDFLEILGVDKEKASLSLPTDVSEVVVVCHTPSTHPFFPIRARELGYGLQLSSTVPVTNRKGVFFSRSARETIPNEDALLESVRNMLKARGREEYLRVITDTDPVKETIGQLMKDCLAFVSFRGLSWALSRFCDEDSLVIEIIPPNAEETITPFEEAQALRQVYYPFISTRESTLPLDLTKILSSQLDRNEAEETLFPAYDWAIEPGGKDMDLYPLGQGPPLPKARIPKLSANRMPNFRHLGRGRL